jgi:hypothetical protein
MKGFATAVPSRFEGVKPIVETRRFSSKNNDEANSNRTNAFRVYKSLTRIATTRRRPLSWPRPCRRQASRTGEASHRFARASTPPKNKAPYPP